MKQLTILILTCIISLCFLSLNTPTNYCSNTELCDIEHIAEESSTIRISTTYNVNFYSGLRKEVRKLDDINNEVNEILSQANIKLVSPNDCDKDPCWWLGSIMHEFLYVRIPGIDIGVNPKHYRHKLNKFDMMVEGLFLAHATFLAQCQRNSANGREGWDGVGHKAELFIHIVNSVDNNNNAIGVYVPDGYRRNYTNQKIKIQNSIYPANTTKYLIVIGYDDIVNSGNNVAQVIAHEIGHALGLGHNDSNSNLMNPYADTYNDELSGSQITSMRRNWKNFRYGHSTSAATYGRLCRLKHK